MKFRFPISTMPSLLLLAAAAGAGVAADPPRTNEVLVTVDGMQTVGNLPLLKKRNVVMIPTFPPPAIAKRLVQEFGPITIVRADLPLDMMWDYRVDKYNFNFRFSGGPDPYENDPVIYPYERKNQPDAGYNTDELFATFSPLCDSIAVAPRRYEREVLNHVITMEQWKHVLKTGLKHYIGRFPNIRYIQILNESQLQPPLQTPEKAALFHAQWKHSFGGLLWDEYYAFYKAGYEVVNELNKEMKLPRPILVGGPVNQLGPENVKPFLERYATDTNPAKRIDFVDFHSYEHGNRPSYVAEWEGIIDGFLAKAGAPTNIPILVSEIGIEFKNFKTRGPDGITILKLPINELVSQMHGVLLTAMHYYGRNSERLIFLPWIPYNIEPWKNFRWMDSAGRLTPYGAAMKMLAMHKSNELAAKSSGLRDDGNGVGVLASAAADGMVIEVWNTDPYPAKGEIALQRLPENLKSGQLVVRKYLIDRTHSYCMDKDSDPGLEMTEEIQMEAQALKSLAVDLECYSLCLWTVANKRTGGHGSKR